MEVLVSQKQVFHVDSLESLQELLCNLRIDSLSTKSVSSNLVIDATAPNNKIHILIKGGSVDTPALDQLIAMLIVARKESHG